MSFFVLVWINPLQFNLRRLNLRNNRESQETHIVLTFYPASLFFFFFFSLRRCFPSSRYCFEHWCRSLCCWLLSLFQLLQGKVSLPAPLLIKKQEEKKDKPTHISFSERVSFDLSSSFSYPFTIHPKGSTLAPTPIRSISSPKILTLLNDNKKKRAVPSS